MYISKDILHKSSGEQFLWNKIEIWAGFGQVSNNEKKIRPIMSNLWGRFSSFQKIVLKKIQILVSAGQLISVWLFGVFNFPKNERKNLMNFCPRN